MASFTEITKQVHSINELILSDMKCNNEDNAAEANNFDKHLLATKFWFARVSYVNKKRFLLHLLQDVSSAWTLSLLLKSMWNCRPKDAVLSISERAACWSSYDQVPMDHNRTAIPVYALSHAMKNDRLWFLSLGPEPQVQVLAELLTIAGGPVMWAVLSRAQTLYSRYQEQMIQNIQECSVVYDANDPHNKNVPLKKDPSPSSATRTPTPTSVQAETVAEPALSPSQGQKNLEANLASWNATIKALRDSLKLEELEMTFNDGTKRKIWKVNRIRPDVMETVDFLQLLPSSVGKRILSFLPQARLAECAKVNRYWDYLVDEYRAELVARTKINSDFDKLEKIVIKNDESQYQFIAKEDLVRPPLSSTEVHSTGPGQKKQTQPSVRPSEKSAGAYSLRCISDKRNKAELAQHPIRNMADLNERMERRGATDENIWKWCKNVIQQTATRKLQESKHVRKSTKMAKKTKKVSLKAVEPAGVLDLENILFPCPLMKHILKVPLNPPLYKDPAEIKPSAKLKRTISSAMAIRAPPETAKRFSLWTRDVSTLYPVLKIPAYQFPS